jgi:hypothetical protein
MSPAGAGTARYRRPCIACFAVLTVTLGALLVGALGTIGGGTARASARPVVAALPGWETFQTDCTSGPSSGQGSSPSACRCWEQHLEAQAILPDYAVGQLNLAQTGAGDAYTVPENLSGQPVGWAMQGCPLAG